MGGAAAAAAARGGGGARGCFGASATGLFTTAGYRSGKKGGGDSPLKSPKSPTSPRSSGREGRMQAQGGWGAAGRAGALASMRQRLHLSPPHRHRTHATPASPPLLNLCEAAPPDLNLSETGPRARLAPAAQEPAPAGDGAAAEARGGGRACAVEGRACVRAEHGGGGGTRGQGAPARAEGESAAWCQPGSGDGQRADARRDLVAPGCGARLEHNQLPAAAGQRAADSTGSRSPPPSGADWRVPGARGAGGSDGLGRGELWMYDFDQEASRSAHGGERDPATSSPPAKEDAVSWYKRMCGGAGGE